MARNVYFARSRFLDRFVMPQSLADLVSESCIPRTGAIRSALEAAAVLQARSSQVHTSRFAPHLLWKRGPGLPKRHQVYCSGGVYAVAYEDATGVQRQPRIQEVG